LPVCSAAGVGTDGGCGGIPPRRQRGTDKTVAGFKKNRLCCPADSRSGLLMAKSDRPITIKRYGERRPYNPGAGGYATLDELGAMVEDEEEFVVYDAATGDDITQSVLKQIIVERARHG